MRHVDLRPSAHCAPASQRLRRHLLFRLLELEEDGLRLTEAPADPFSPWAGPVTAALTGHDAAVLAGRLASDYGVFVESGPSNTLTFAVGPGVSFEDIDYAQGAIYRLLSEGV